MTHTFPHSCQSGFCFMSVVVLPVCMSVLHMHAWCLRRAEKGIGSLKTGVTHGCELPFGCWKLNLSSLEDRLMLLTAKLFLQCHPTCF